MGETHQETGARISPDNPVERHPWSGPATAPEQDPPATALTLRDRKPVEARAIKLGQTLVLFADRLGSRAAVRFGSRVVVVELVGPGEYLVQFTYPARDGIECDQVVAKLSELGAP